MALKTKIEIFDTVAVEGLMADLLDQINTFDPDYFKAWVIGSYPDPASLYGTPVPGE